MSEKAKEQENLVDFNWDTNDDVFFGVTPEGFEPTETKVEDEVVTNTTDDTETKKGPGRPKKEESKEEEATKDDFTFGEEVKKEVEEEEETTKPNKDNEGQGSIFNDLYADLRENGIFKHIELGEEDTDISAERFFELQEAEIEAEIDSRLEAFANDLDDEAKALIKYVREGGSTRDFFATYSETSGVPHGDIEEDDFQDKVIRYQLEKEGWDRDEIEDRIEFLTQKGNKRKMAERAYEKIQEEVEEERTTLEERNRQAQEMRKRQIQEYDSGIKKTLNENDEFHGFKISAKEKSKLQDYLTKRNIKLENGQTISGFQKGLADVMRDPSKTILLAKFIESDFDMSQLEKRIKTKETNKIKSRLENRTATQPKGSGSSTKGQSLADFF